MSEEQQEDYAGPEFDLRLMNESPFLTIQGEGFLIGTPSVFVRTAGCDLRCTRDKEAGRYWNCDTPESLNDFNHRLKVWRAPSKKTYVVDPSDLAKTIREKWPLNRFIVITGGEPMLQATPLLAFLSELHIQDVHANRAVDPRNFDAYNITIETNARHFDESLAEYITNPSLSPKLQYYGDVEKEAIKEWAMYCAAAGKPMQVKIVCCDATDFSRATEIFEYAQRWLDVECIIQPAWEFGDLKALADVVAADGRYRLIPQTHKILGVP